jgi:hypothetical protein
MAGGIPRAVRLIASRVAENPGSGSAQGAEGGRWSQRARTSGSVATGQLHLPMTAERRRHGAQRLDTSESTRHPGQPCIEQAAPLGRVYAVARGHRTILAVLTSHR